MVEIFMILGKFATLEINSKIYHANKIMLYMWSFDQHSGKYSISRRKVIVISVF